MPDLEKRWLGRGAEFLSTGLLLYFVANRGWHAMMGVSEIGEVCGVGRVVGPQRRLLQSLPTILSHTCTFTVATAHTHDGFNRS